MALSSNAQKIFDLVKQLTAVELSELVTSLEEEFGVTAAAMVVSGGAAGGDAGGAAAKDSVNVELTDAGQQKIAVIKVVKELMNIDLKAAKDLVEKAPVVIKEGVKQDEGEMLQTKLQEAGATVTLK
jgi:large subunit ribosomal protein L7/L12